MFFYLAKVLWFLLQPSTLIALLIAYGAILIWTGWARWGRRFVTVGAILLLVAGLSPLGNALILPLENRFPRANEFFAQGKTLLPLVDPRVFQVGQDRHPNDFPNRFGSFQYAS